MSRTLRWYVFEQIEGSEEFDVTSWSRTKEAARVKVQKADPQGGRSDGPAPKAFQVFAQGREAARKEAAEVFGVKVRGYMDKDEKKLGRYVVKAAVMSVIFCPYTGVVLDMRRAVVIETGTRSWVMTGAHWDSLGKAEKGIILGRPGVKVYDGRVLFKR